MAATLDANLGTKAQAGSATATLVTTSAAAAGSLIVVGVGYFTGGGGTASVTTAGGLTWAATTRTQSGSLNGYIFYAYAPSGLASSTSLTWTMSTSTGDWMIGGGSFLDVLYQPGGRVYRRRLFSGFVNDSDAARHQRRRGDEHGLVVWVDRGW